MLQQTLSNSQSILDTVKPKLCSSLVNSLTYIRTKNVLFQIYIVRLVIKFPLDFYQLQKKAATLAITGLSARCSWSYRYDIDMMHVSISLP